MSRFPFLPGLSVRARLGLMQLLLLAALLVTGGVSWRAIHQERNAGQGLALLSRTERRHLDADMMHDALRADVNAALRTVAGDPAAAAAVVATQRRNAAQYQSDLQQLQDLALPADLAARFAAAAPRARAYIGESALLVETALRDHAAALALEPAFLQTFEELVVINDGITQQLARRVEAAEQLTLARASGARNWIILTSLITLLAVFLFFGLIARSIRNSLRRVSDAARALAAGNLSVRSEVASHDEVGELALSLNKMADELQHLIDRLLSDADRDAFTAQLMQALEMAETERDAQAVVRRAMAQIAGDLPMEMLLAAHEQSDLHPVVEHPVCGPARCSVESLGGCVAVRRGAPLVFDDSAALNACPRLQGRDSVPGAAVCVPVTFMGRALGVLHVASALPQAPTAKQVAQLTALGMQAGARIGAVRAFDRAQLHAYSDALTGLSNRRALDLAVATLEDSQTRYAFAFADLDLFKNLNDTHGHDAGDKALRLFAEVLRTQVRQGDKAARWGGEEFALLFAGSTGAQVVEVLERIRGALAEALLASGAPPFTASFGVSDSGMADTFEQTMRLADEALYQSKRRGRDCVSLARAIPPCAERTAANGEAHHLTA